jgi:hypothetical protein
MGVVVRVVMEGTETVGGGDGVLLGFGSGFSRWGVSSIE